jgi:hypothetical protein
MIRCSGNGAWILRWQPGERKTIYLCALLLGACGFVLLAYMAKMWGDYRDHLSAGSLPPFGDFLAIWSYAKIAGLHPATELYDFATLHARQVAVGMIPGANNPFPYPPTFILLLWPLGLLPYLVAWMAWMGGTFALFVWAVAGTCSRRMVCVVGAVVAPVSVIALDSGQSGFLAAALMIGGIRLARSRPVVAGVLIGLLSYKPQLGFLVPIALGCAGLWGAFGVACLTVAGLAAAATVAFGWGVWPAWVAMLPAYAEMFDRSKVQLQFMPTVVANLRLLGCPPGVAHGVQAVAGVVVVMFVARCFRRDPGRLAAAALLVGTFLATPHAFIYDMPMVMAAVALFIEDRLATSRVFDLGEVVVLAWVVMFPVLMVAAGVAVPLSVLPLALFFGLIVRRQGMVAA